MDVCLLARVGTARKAVRPVLGGVSELRALGSVGAVRCGLARTRDVQGAHAAVERESLFAQFPDRHPNCLSGLVLDVWRVSPSSRFVKPLLQITLHRSVKPMMMPRALHCTRHPPGVGCPETSDPFLLAAATALPEFYLSQFGEGGAGPLFYPARGAQYWGTCNAARGLPHVSNASEACALHPNSAYISSLFPRVY